MGLLRRLLAKLKPYSISLNRVHDTVRISEGFDKIKLRVDEDPMRMVAGLNRAQAMLKALTAEDGEDKTHEAALYFAGVIFGEAQARALLDFYRGDAACAVNVCGRYFTERLSGLIERAQKRMR